MSNLNAEQVRADIGRWKREIRNERTRHRLTDEHPNISRRLARIRIAEQLLDKAAGQTLVEHPFRSLNGSDRCVAIVGAMNSGLACGLLPKNHQPTTTTGSSAGGAQ